MNFDFDDLLETREEKRENPVDVGGPGRIDNEHDGVPGEQHGSELDTWAQNRPRKKNGEFTSATSDSVHENDGPEELAGFENGILDSVKDAFK